MSWIFSLIEGWIRIIRLILMMGMGLRILMVIWAVMSLIAKMKILNKGGYSGALVLVPYYGEYLFYKLADSTALYWMGWVCGLMTLWGWIGGKIVLMLIGLIAAVVLRTIFHCKLAEEFGKGKAFGIGMTIFPVLFWMILGFGSAEYQENQRVVSSYEEKYGWRCPCGQINRLSALYCSTCFKAKSNQYAKISTAGTWWCSCGTQNRDSQMYCTKCSEEKPRKS